ncbi:MAG: CDP-diacylglycerol--serine O-phosphatidyltransferase [Desulfobacterales bacterium]
MRRKSRNKRGRGIYILPNLFTTFNMFFGFFSIICSINGQFIQAAIVIMIAAVFDMLDGKIARATNTTSKFGIEYDSLADLVSFGIAPGLMMFMWALEPLGRIGWLAAFLFLACGALRLARFNTQAGTVDNDHFVGLPIPAAAGMTAAAVLLANRIQTPGDVNPLAVLIFLYGLSFLMVSTIKYYSFKQPELFNRMNFNVLVAAILVIILIAAQPAITLFLLGFSYILSGPVNSVRRYVEIRQQKAEARDT